MTVFNAVVLCAECTLMTVRFQESFRQVSYQHHLQRYNLKVSIISFIFFALFFTVFMLQLLTMQTEPAQMDTGEPAGHSSSPVPLSHAALQALPMGAPVLVTWADDDERPGRFFGKFDVVKYKVSNYCCQYGSCEKIFLQYVTFSPNK